MLMKPEESGTTITDALKRATLIFKHNVQQPYGLGTLIIPILPMI